MSPQKLGMNLKRVREKRGLTQAALAGKAAVHPVYVAQIEAGTKVPSLALLEHLAKVLKVKMGELLD